MIVFKSKANACLLLPAAALRPPAATCLQTADASLHSPPRILIMIISSGFIYIYIKRYYYYIYDIINYYLYRGRLLQQCYRRGSFDKGKNESPPQEASQAVAGEAEAGLKFPIQFSIYLIFLFLFIYSAINMYAGGRRRG